MFYSYCTLIGCLWLRFTVTVLLTFPPVHSLRFDVAGPKITLCVASTLMWYGDVMFFLMWGII
jgi:hypothetical protein